MSETETLVLGCIAGGTILLGLPLGRMRAAAPGLRQFLNAVAVGILVFILWDVLSNAYGPIDQALGNVRHHTAGLAPVVGYGALFFAGIGLGLIGLSAYQRLLAGRAKRPASPGPGAVAEAELSRLSEGQRLAVLVAVGIGLHNFGEGLAIGTSAAKGAITLATLLVIGFALHNATEGFGIVAPLTAEGRRPGWGFLLLLGAVGGGPTLVGTALGRQFTSPALSVLFLTLAAGSILYVIIQLVGVARKAGAGELLYWGIFVGLLAGFVTDMVVSAAGA
ncbi:MAG TPA: hypothetical protein VE152_03245 [Acidimicrobiales bacterium]|nr:hypothetical protein [Acidimicrobiales bacterium]